MKILIVHPQATCISARKLAAAMGGTTYNLTTGKQREFPGYDLVWNYGSREVVRADHLVNRPIAVQRCVDKIQTFEILRRYGLPTVDFTIFKHNVPDFWKSVVIRSQRDGRKAEGLEYAEQGDPIPDGQLFTEYFPHVHEYRVVCGFGRVIGRYRKDRVENDWYFTHMSPQGFGQVDKDCLKAARVLGIDYVGFDVLEDTKGDCVILEANSGAMIQDEALEFVKQHSEAIVNYIQAR